MRKYLPSVLMFYALINICGVPESIQVKINSKAAKLKNELYDNHIVQKISPPYKIDMFYFTMYYIDVTPFQLEYNDIFRSDPYYSPSSLCEKSVSFFLRRFHVYQEGPYEIENVRILKGDVVIDVGAHMGMFSLLAMNQGARIVYAFEPNPRIYTQCLQKQIELNHGQDVIIPIPCGVGAKEEQISFIDCEVASHSSAIANIDHIESIDHPRFADSEVIKVNITTLDAFVHENNILHIDFIKADIEGAERLMLEGARNTIKQFHPRLAICTYHLPDDKEVLTSIIKEIDPSYNIRYTSHKLYAW